MDGELYTVIGVTPFGFDFPSAQTQALIPLWREVAESNRRQRGNHRFMPTARLKRGVSVEQARAELDGIAQRIRQQFPESLTGQGANVAPMQERVVAHVRRLLPFLLWAVTCVLLIAYLNVPNLPLARAEGRRREVAVRATLSAERWRITRQFVIESLLLAVCGAVVELAFAAWGTDILIRMAGNIPRIQAVRVNSAVLAFTAALSILTGVAVGLALAFSSRRTGLAQAMQAGGRSSTAGKKRGGFAKRW